MKKAPKYIKVKCKSYFGIHKQDYSTVCMDVPDEATADHLLKCLNGRDELLELLLWSFQFVPIGDDPVKFKRVMEILKEEEMV